MKSYELSESNYKILDLLFRGYCWIHFESKVPKPIEEIVEYGGKYIIYGSKEYVKKLAEKIKPMIGEVIEGIKYSTVPLKENSYGLVVYCDKRNRDETLKILEKLKVSNYEWKTDKESWRDCLSDPWFSFILRNINPEGFRKICKLVGAKEPALVSFALNLSAELAPVFKNIGKKLKEGKVEEAKKELQAMNEKLYSLKPL